MKQLLQTLTPAESLLLRKGDVSPKQEILKLTLLDLVLKNVLAIRTIQRQPNSRDPISTYQYVSRGENFDRYSPLPHELVYLTDFLKSLDLQMIFKNAIKVAFEHAGSERKIRDTVRSSPELTNAFSSSWLGKITGVFDYTDKGLAKRVQLENEIAELEQKVKRLLATNCELALEELSKIGGNILLLHGLDMRVLADIEEAFLKSIPVPVNASGCAGGCATFTSHSNDFDSSYPSDSSDSGCSGDGGCSSGCGGCGGD